MNSEKIIHVDHDDRQDLVAIVLEEAHLVEGVHAIAFVEETPLDFLAPKPWCICQSIYIPQDLIDLRTPSAGLVDQAVSGSPHEDWSASLIIGLLALKERRLGVSEPAAPLVLGLSKPAAGSCRGDAEDHVLREAAWSGRVPADVLQVGIGASNAHYPAFGLDLASAPVLVPVASPGPHDPPGEVLVPQHLRGLFA